MKKYSAVIDHDRGGVREIEKVRGAIFRSGVLLQLAKVFYGFSLVTLLALTAVTVFRPDLVGIFQILFLISLLSVRFFFCGQCRDTNNDINERSSIFYQNRTKKK
jgi:hypothetical protein